MSGTQLVDGKRRPAWDVDPDSVVIVGLDTNDGPEHPLWDKRISLPLDPAMLASIEERGVVMPIRVAKQGDTVYVVAGRQRVKHAREVNRRRRERGLPEDEMRLVPCIGERMRDPEAQSEIAAIENEIRRNTSPLDKAEEAQRRIDRGVPIARVALAFGVSIATVQAWLKLLGLAAPIKAAIESGSVAATAAAKWADLPVKDQVAALELAVAESGGKRVSIAKAARVANPGAVQRPPKKLLLRAVETMPGAFADGIRFALGLLPEDERPDAIAALFGEEVERAAE